MFVSERASSSMKHYFSLVKKQNDRAENIDSKFCNFHKKRKMTLKIPKSVNFIEFRN